MENGVWMRVSNDTLEISLPWSASRTRDKVKAELQGRRWDPTRKLWLVPLSARNISTLLSRFDVDAPLRAELGAKREQDKQRQQVSLSLSAARDGDLDLPSLNGVLRPFQKAGVRFALLHRGVLWADDQGLGKSVQSIATVE